MMQTIDWAEAEKLGLVLPLPEKENLAMTSHSFRVTGALHIARPQDIIPSPQKAALEPPQGLASAVAELIQDYGEKASIVASDRAHMAWEQRNFHRRDFWISVFEEIRKNTTFNKAAPLPEKASCNEKTLQNV